MTLMTRSLGPSSWDTPQDPRGYWLGKVLSVKSQLLVRSSHHFSGLPRLKRVKMAIFYLNKVELVESSFSSRWLSVLKHRLCPWYSQHVPLKHSFSKAVQNLRAHHLSAASTDFGGTALAFCSADAPKSLSYRGGLMGCGTVYKLHIWYINVMVCI